MTARTHDAIAFASLVTVAVLNPPEKLSVLTLFVSIVANVIGGILPDIDQAGSRLWDFLPAGNTLGRILRKIFYKHRTISHSILGSFLVYEFFMFVLPRVFNPQYVDYKLVVAGLMIGYISHLVADCFTKEGLPLLFPVQWTFGFPPIEALRITTGKWVEKFIVFPGVGVYFIIFVYLHQLPLLEILKLVKH